MRILLFYDNFIRDFRGLMLLKELLMRRGHDTQIDPLWDDPTGAVRAFDPDSVVMGQIGEKTTYEVGRFIADSGINLVLNTTENVCYEDRKPYFFRANFRDWNYPLIEIQVVISKDFNRYVQEHPDILAKEKYHHIGCPRFDLSVHPEICSLETAHVSEKYGLDRFARKLLYISSFIFDEAGGQTSEENLEFVNIPVRLQREMAQKRQHHEIILRLIEDLKATNGVLLIKRHPWDKSSYYDRHYGGDHVVLVDNHDYIVPLLQSTDAVLHTESTVAIEGWIQRKKTVSILPDFDGDRTRLKNHMTHEPVVTDYGELCGALDDYPWECTDQSLANYAPFVDGEATSRLADLIDRLSPIPGRRHFQLTEHERETRRQQRIHARLTIAERLKTLSPDDYLYHFLRLEQYRRRIENFYEDAIRQHAAERYPLPPAEGGIETPETILRRAEDAHALGRLDEALAAVLPLLSLDDDRCRGRAHLLAARCRQARQDDAAARRHYQAACDSDPANGAARKAYAAFLFGAGDATGAVDQCRAVLDDRPDDEDALMLLSDAAAATGKHALATDFARRVLAIEPTHPEGSARIREAANAGSEDGYRPIIADNDLANILAMGQAERFGRWAVRFHGLTIRCRDLLAFYTAAKDIFLQGIYDFDAVKPDPVVIDGGGHIGLFTLYVKQKYPNARITAFEPDAESLALLEANIALNGWTDVTVVPAGLYAKDGTVQFGSDHSDGSSIFSKEADHSIPVARLGPYLASSVDFLKLNIEGAELDVLEDVADALRQVREMVIEYHGFPEIGQRLHPILSILDRSGFRYLVHDFDHQTNPATKPPFRADASTRFFLLIYARRQALPSTVDTADQDLPQIKAIGSYRDVSSAAMDNSPGGHPSSTLDPSFGGDGALDEALRPRLLIYTLWRSGTHWLSNMVADLLEMSWEYTDGADSEKEVLCTLAMNHISVRHMAETPEQVMAWADAYDFDVLFLHRAPHDVVASSVNMRKHVEGYRPDLPPFPDMAINDILKWDLSTYAHHYTGLLQDWINTDHPRLHQVAYEDLVHDCTRVMDHVARFVGASLSDERLARTIARFEFKKVSGRGRGQENKSSHYRKGIVGDWRRQFDDEGIALIERILGPSTAPASTVSGARLMPISRQFGFDRGTPIDRFYIEAFLDEHRRHITGRVLEIGDAAYTRQFGSAVTSSDVLNAAPGPGVTIVGDLTEGGGLQEGAYDCIILTQTIQCIYNVKAALSGAVRALKPGGHLLLTASGISQISRYDMDRWGEYWRFTDHSLARLLKEAAPGADIRVTAHGNVAVAKAFLDGRAQEELTQEILEVRDDDYQVVLTAIVHKTGSSTGAAVISPAGPSVLLYHRVSEDPLDPQLLAVSPKHFNDHLTHLKKHCRVVPLSVLMNVANDGQSAGDMVAITVDDGYADNLADALPIIEAHQLPVTIFVTAGGLDEPSEFWWDALEHLFFHGAMPERLDIGSDDFPRIVPTGTPAERIQAYKRLCNRFRAMTPADINRVLASVHERAGRRIEACPAHRRLSTAELRRLARSPFVEIGAHTVSHACLSALAPEEQMREIYLSKKILEEITGGPVHHFSYPFGTGGDFTGTTAAIVKLSGFSSGIANAQGRVTAPLDRYRVPRRLVRNWNGEVFAQWLSASNGSELDQIALAQRDRRLKNFMTNHIDISGGILAGDHV